jgi:hypothetical protein
VEISRDASDICRIPAAWDPNLDYGPMRQRPASFAAPARRAGALGVLALTFACASSKDGGAAGDACFPDADGFTGYAYTLDLTVDDAAFSKRVLSTQNNSTVTLTLKNVGTLPHGFELACVDVTTEYPSLPAGCPRVTCFPDASTIAPLMPGDSQTVTFVTPTTDNLIYPFESSAADDANVPGLVAGQWSLM